MSGVNTRKTDFLNKDIWAELMQGKLHFKINARIQYFAYDY